MRGATTASGADLLFRLIVRETAPGRRPDHLHSPCPTKPAARRARRTGGWPNPARNARNRRAWALEGRHPSARNRCRGCFLSENATQLQGPGAQAPPASPAAIEKLSVDPDAPIKQIGRRPRLRQPLGLLATHSGKVTGEDADGVCGEEVRGDRPFQSVTLLLLSSVAEKPLDRG